MSNGYHNISITSLSNNNWSSCPTINNGFSYSRYFYTWIQDIESYKTINITNNEI